MNARKCWIALGIVALLAPGRAGAGDFSPSAGYQFCTAGSTEKCTHNYKASSTPQVRVTLEQDAGEEEISHATLKVPAGFRLPRDEQISDGERVGIAHIEIDYGSGCSDGSGTQPFALDGDLRERDRTAKETARGVRVVFRLDLSPAPPIYLKAHGNVQRGYRVEADVPQDDSACPPFSLAARLFARSEVSRTPIVRNPATPGTYTFRVIFTGTQGSVSRSKQTVEIV